MEDWQAMAARGFFFILLIFFCDPVVFAQDKLHSSSSSTVANTPGATGLGQAKRKLVILGDSLTEGYGVAKTAAFPALVEKRILKLGKRWQVINSGVSGSTTGSAPSRMKWVLRTKPDLVLLFLGANDGLRGLKVEESEKNLLAAIAIAKEANAKIILGGLYMPPNYGADYRLKFEKMYKDVAKAQGVQLIPFILKDVAGQAHLNLADGIHPNEEGHKIMAENVFSAIKDQL